MERVLAENETVREFVRSDSVTCSDNLAALLQVIKSNYTLTNMITRLSYCVLFFSPSQENDLDKRTCVAVETLLSLRNQNRSPDHWTPLSPASSTDSGCAVSSEHEETVFEAEERREEKPITQSQDDQVITS